MKHVGRIRITEELARLKDNLENHCHINVKRVQRHFLAWVTRCWKYLKKVNKLSDEIQKLNRDTESLHFNMTKGLEELVRILPTAAHGIDGSSQHWQVTGDQLCDIKQHATNVNMDGNITGKKPSSDIQDSRHKHSLRPSGNVKITPQSDGKQLQASLRDLASQQEDLRLMLTESTKMLQCLEDQTRERPTSAEPPSRYTTS
jgi:hypothetical protein